VPAASTRVLLVEDEALDALQVTRSLRAKEAWDERYDVRCTRTLAQGLEQLARDRVDVVLLDLCLPDSEAAETVARMRARDGSTPLVVFTGCEDAEVTARAFQAGADDFLVKGDFDAGLLRRTLRHAIERRRASRVASPLGANGNGARAADQEVGRALLHHLKNVQTCILGNARILQRELADGGFLRERADSLVGAARIAAELVHQLSDATADCDEWVELSELVLRAEPLLRAVIPEELELNFDLAPSLPRVAARTEALSRALLELVVNACEAMEGRVGSVLVRTGEGLLAASEVPALVAPAGIDPGSHVWLEVRDDGPGIDLFARARLFERGFSTKGASRGHGLGEVREIVAGHRGGLRIESRPGEGTAFRILLPLGSEMA